MGVDKVHTLGDSFLQLMENLLTPQETALFLRVSVRQLRRLKVPCIRFGRLVRYRPSDVNRWVEARRYHA